MRHQIRPALVALSMVLMLFTLTACPDSNKNTGDPPRTDWTPWQGAGVGGGIEYRYRRLSDGQWLYMLRNTGDRHMQFKFRIRQKSSDGKIHLLEGSTNLYPGGVEGPHNASAAGSIVGVQIYDVKVDR